MAALEAAVDSTNPKWRANAAKRTAKFVKAAGYSEASPMWSSVKPVFMAAQKNKCLFCERQFESELYGKIEFDLEHFRPKSSVLSWPVVGRHEYYYEFGLGEASPSGYYWLAYQLSNYAASCKVCNSNLKSNFFPIAGDRIAAPGDLRTEKAFLCYAIGSDDEDPESLVNFVATTAVPSAGDDERRRRGQVIIDFFDLNKREELHRQRASMIILLGSALANIAAGTGDEADETLAARIVTGVYPHTNCMRSFRRLWDSDQPFARRVLTACKLYYASATGANPPSL
jgi:hypothetical protein